MLLACWRRYFQLLSLGQRLLASMRVPVVVGRARSTLMRWMNGTSAYVNTHDGAKALSCTPYATARGGQHKRRAATQPLTRRYGRNAFSRTPALFNNRGKEMRQTRQQRANPDLETVEGALLSILGADPTLPAPTKWRGRDHHRQRSKPQALCFFSVWQEQQVLAKSGRMHIYIVVLVYFRNGTDTLICPISYFSHSPLSHGSLTVRHW